MSDHKRWQLAGWLLFIVCAVLYTISAAHNGDRLALIGSLVFLVACFFFLVPLLKR